MSPKHSIHLLPLQPLCQISLCFSDLFLLTLTLVSHCLTAVKLGSEVMSYITITLSALRKNCLVMLRYLQGKEGERMW